MSNRDPIFSFVIVNYNGLKYISDCVESITKNIAHDYEIIVVDNASTDGSTEYLCENHQKVKLICSDKNLGFAGGNNLGVKAANGKYIVLLNNDAFLLTGLESAIEVLNTTLDVAIVGGTMLGRSGEYRWSAGHFPTPLRLIKIGSMYVKEGPFRLGNFSIGNPAKCYSVDWLEASLWVIRKSLWEDLRGLDEEYFMYGEDVDFCRRVRDSGYRVVYLPSIRYIHVGGYSPRRFPMLVKGFQRYHKKYSRPFTRVLASVVLQIGITARYVHSRLAYSVRGDEQYKEKSDACLAVLLQRLW